MFSLSVWGFYLFQLSRSPANGDHEKSISFLLTSYVGWIKVRISTLEEMDPAGLWADPGERRLCEEEITFSYSPNLNDGFMVMLYVVM